MLRTLWKRATGQFASWGIPLLSLYLRAPLRRQPPRVKGETSRIRTIAAESDLKALCANLAQTFAHLFHTQWAEVEVSGGTATRGFSVVWASPDNPGRKQPPTVISVPLVAEREQIGLLRLGQTSDPGNRIEERELAVLAQEAALLVYSGLHLAKVGETAASAERLRLAAQLHHGLAQHLANALMRLQLAQQSVVRDPAQAQESLRSSLTSMQTAMDAMRATIYSLQYAGKEEPRIATLLRATMERLRSITTAEVHLDMDHVGVLSPAVEAGIATVVSEAMTNAAKHAAAQHIHVVLSMTDEGIAVEVRDDGKGFDSEERLRRGSRWDGFGLALMKDQVNRLGGTLHIHSLPSQGTSIKVHLRHPLGRKTDSGLAEGAHPDVNEPRS